MAAPSAYRVGIDVGGTFTDLVALPEDGGDAITIKVASTPRAPEEGVLAALRMFLDQSSAAPIRSLAHSTTLATNALLGQMHLELPRVALFVTEGFRDIIEIGRQNRSEIYNLLVMRPKPLVARNDRLPIRERIDFEGNVLQPLDRDSLQRAIDHVRKESIQSVAIGFLHSYVNDSHERVAAEILREALPGVSITRSAQINNEYREYERLSTAVVNAALLPIMGRYIASLERGIEALGIEAPLYIMQSHGGMSRADEVMRRPASIIESGPASGVIAAAALGRRRKLHALISFDMGGTTAKAGSVVDALPHVATEFEAAGKTHSGRALKGSGYPVRFPFIDLAEVSAGGGTIAWTDEAGGLHVGPLSAGADPGPACYGKSERATVTDANVVLGRINPNALLGGSFPIDARRAHQAIARIAGILSLSVEQTALGIVRIVDNEMAKVLRIVTVERGLDPRDFTLVAFGGNGGLHACAVADELHMRTIVVPAHPGLFSAQGLLAGTLQATTVRAVMQTTLDEREAEALFTALETQVGDELRRQGAGTNGVRLRRELDARYAGQAFELAVSANAGIAAGQQAFHGRHAAVYGYDVPGEAVEIVNARVTGESAARPSAVLRSARTPVTATIQSRDIWCDEARRNVAVLSRSQLDGSPAPGPLLIEEYDACTYVAPGWSAQLNESDLVLERHERP